MPSCLAHCKSTGRPCTNPQVGGSMFCFSHRRLRLSEIRIKWRKISDLLYHVDLPAMLAEHGRVTTLKMLAQALQHPVTRSTLTGNHQLHKVAQFCKIPVH